MYWPGDSREKHARRLWLDIGRVWREEILCGYRSNIPTCCIAWYLLTVFLCLITRKDLIILPLMFGQDGWEEFLRLDYYRCPICRLREHEVKVTWWSEPSGLSDQN